MNISLNSRPYKVEKDATLFDFLQSQNMTDKKGIAVAINEIVMPKSIWDTTILKEEDKILIITATQGG